VIALSLETTADSIVSFSAQNHYFGPPALTARATFSCNLKRTSSPVERPTAMVGLAAPALPFADMEFVPIPTPTGNRIRQALACIT